MSNKIYLLVWENWKVLYIPHNTEKTNYIAASIVYNDRTEKKFVMIGKEPVLEKAVARIYCPPLVLREYKLLDDIVEFIRGIKKKVVKLTKPIPLENRLLRYLLLK